MSLEWLIRRDPQRTFSLDGLDKTEALLELLVIKDLVIFVHKLNTVIRDHISDGPVDLRDLE